MNKILALLLIVTTLLTAQEAHDIIQKLDENMRGQNIYMQISMKIASKGHERTMRMQSYSQGTKKSFVKIIYPPRDRGITFLSLDNQMWQYVPKIERIIKIPAIDDASKMDGK